MVWKIVVVVVCLALALMFYCCCCVASEADRQMEEGEARMEPKGEDHSSTGI